MATSGRKVFPDRQEGPHPLPQVRLHEAAPRPITAYAHDYAAGHRTTPHAHPRAQLLWAVSGVMRVETETASFTLPPQRALFVPADLMHQVSMPGPVAMRALFIHPDAAADIPLGAIVVGPLLRALILRLAEEPPDWDLPALALPCATWPCANCVPRPASRWACPPSATRACVASPLPCRTIRATPVRWSISPIWLALPPARWNVPSPARRG